ncbi:MAG: hypothetical protein MJ252_15250, partial [archaeon]|nr:hypothetical protein [archaeon]
MNKETIQTEPDDEEENQDKVIKFLEKFSVRGMIYKLLRGKGITYQFLVIIIMSLVIFLAASHVVHYIVIAKIFRDEVLTGIRYEILDKFIVRHSNDSDQLEISSEKIKLQNELTAGMFFEIYFNFLSFTNSSFDLNETVYNGLEANSTTTNYNMEGFTKNDPNSKFDKLFYFLMPSMINTA